MKLPFNEKLFNLTRLDIMMTLHGEQPIPFSELRDALKLSDGNLAGHLKVLEKIGYVSSYKSFVNKKPQTTYRVTEDGEENLNNLMHWFYKSFLEGWE